MLFSAAKIQIKIGLTKYQPDNFSSSPGPDRGQDYFNIEINEINEFCATQIL